MSLSLGKSPYLELSLAKISSGLKAIDCLARSLHTPAHDRDTSMARNLDGCSLQRTTGSGSRESFPKIITIDLIPIPEHPLHERRTCRLGSVFRQSRLELFAQVRPPGNPSDTPGSEDDREFFLDGRIDEIELFVGRALSDRDTRNLRCRQCR
jgi:hypothetical protein